MSYVIQPVAQTSLTIDGSEDRFPVRRIYCVGRNYRAHAIEMGIENEVKKDHIRHGEAVALGILCEIYYSNKNCKS